MQQLNNRIIEQYLNIYFKNKPLFLGLIRAKELELFNGYAKLNKRVLDFGCGEGFFCEQLEINKQAEVIGLEVDRQAAEQARERGVYKKVVVYKGKQIPFEPDTFDIVFSNCVLEHIPKLNSSLTEIYRVLKPGGSFYTTVMTDKWEEYLLGSLLFGNLYKKWMRKIQKHYNLLSAKNWQIAFESAGFKVENKVGYMDKRASRWMDFLHYVSIGSLISYKLTGKWVLFPRQYELIPINRWFSGLVKDDVPITKSAAGIFVLKK